MKKRIILTFSILLVLLLSLSILSIEYFGTTQQEETVFSGEPEIMEFSPVDVIEVDLDQDSVLNLNDACSDTPSGESINQDGCSCSQIVVDDGNYCTDDECVDGVATHTNNDELLPEISNCLVDKKIYFNGGIEKYDYPESGYSYCKDGRVVEWDCTPKITYEKAAKKSRGGSVSVSSLSTPAGVPEFSTLTLAMAVVGGCLGLAFLRRE